MHMLSLAVLSTAMLAINATPGHTDPCRIQTVRSVQGQTVCIYNCAGTARTVTTAGSVYPVILE